MDAILDMHADADRRARMVSPHQAAGGAFFGGPIGFAYFVRRNYIAVGDTVAARKMSAMCMLLVLAWNAVVALVVMAPKPMASVLSVVLGAMPFALMIAAYRIARRQVESPDRQPVFCSNWRVLGSAALCSLASGACTLAAIVVALMILLANSGFR